MAAPTCTWFGDVVAATCNGLLPLEYWFYAGLFLLVATLAVHLVHAERVPWQARVAATFLGLLFVTTPFTAVDVSTGVTSMELEEQTVKRECLALQDDIAANGCPETRDGVTVTVDNETFDCIAEGYISRSLCDISLQK